jgi:hypothetical protein
METKTFSVEDGSIRIHQDDIRLYSSMHDANGRGIIASTDINDVVNYGLYLLPSILIRNQTDEELAEDWSKDYHCASSKQDVAKESFFAGRKSVGGEYSKEDMISFAKWLQKEDTEANAESWCHYTDSDMFEYWLKEVHSKAIYPHTITVEHDGEKYLWETLKAEY